MLYAIARGDARWQRDLWRIFDVSRATVSRMLIALEKLGMVRRTRIAGHASRFLDLTRTGERVIADAIEGCQRPMCLLFESFFRSDCRRRLDRAWEVIQIDDQIQWIAAEFGDRSRFFYPCSHPEDIGGHCEAQGDAAGMVISAA